MRLIDSTRLILESDGKFVSLHDIVNAPTIEAKTEADVISAYNEGVAYGAEQAVRHGRPLTVEKLQAMDGSPVWVEVIDHSVFADKADDFDGWGLVRKSWVRVWDEKRADLVKVDYNFNDYGKEWVAYGLPVQHGRWIDNEDYMFCSECGMQWNYCDNDTQDFKFCPNCGAKMDGGAE